MNETEKKSLLDFKGDSLRFVCLINHEGCNKSPLLVMRQKLLATFQALNSLVQHVNNLYAGFLMEFVTLLTK